MTLDKVGAALSALGLGLIVYGLLRSGTWEFMEAEPTGPVWLGVSPAIVEENTAARVRALQVSFGLLALFAVAALPVAGRLPRTPAVSKRPDPGPSPTLKVRVPRQSFRPSRERMRCPASCDGMPNVMWQSH